MNEGIIGMFWVSIDLRDLIQAFLFLMICQAGQSQEIVRTTRTRKQYGTLFRILRSFCFVEQDTEILSVFEQNRAFLEQFVSS